MNIEQLNADFAIDGQLEFTEGKGGLIHARIDNGLAVAVVSTYAGQVLSFRPAGEEKDLLFVSEAAHHSPGKAIKGGIPVCWPWFGGDPRGAHGFVRNRQWQVLETRGLDDGATRITLGMGSNEATREIWPHDFELRLQVTVGRSLEIALISRNSNDHALGLGQALHTYFSLGDIARARVMGLEDKRYIDKVDGGREKIQHGAVHIDGEVDRIYLDVDGDLVIRDPAWDRRIRIAASGSRSAVVWNPWVEKAASMGDFQDDEYQGMLCVETANAGPDEVTLEPGDEYRLGARYSVEPL